MNNQTEEIKDRIDIVDLVQEYMKLTPAGVGNFRALCPFHNEKTPSFMVSKDKQIFHCFGCGEGGDVFSWVQKMEGVEFPEALRILARKANVKLEFQEPKISSAKTKLYDINRAAAEYWHNLLLKEQAAEPVRDYLKQRNINQETVLEWQLGWSRDEWDDIVKYLKSLGYDSEQIFNAGLTVKSDKSKENYDRFRNRLLFPIANHHGQVVGFTGRTMADEDAKYVNTPQTEIYNKSRILFGLDKTKSFIRKNNYAILVEGNMDVIAVWQAGTKNVVGVSGTALTLEQISLLKRYTNNIMISFDADSAGQKAALRGLDLAWQQGLNVKVIILPYGKDPDECIKKDKQLWRQAIKDAVNIIDYYFKVVMADLDLSRSDHKKKAATELLPVIARLPDEIDRNHYLQKLADILKVPVNVLEKKIVQVRDKNKVVKQDSEQTIVKKQSDPRQMVTERIMALLWQHPHDVKLIIDDIEPDDLKDDIDKIVYKELIIHYNKDDFVQQSDDTIREQIIRNIDQSTELKKRAGVWELLAVKDFHSLTDLERSRELEQLCHRLRKEKLLVDRQQVSLEISKQEQLGNDEEVDKLVNKYNEINQKINQLS